MFYSNEVRQASEHGETTRKDIKEPERALKMQLSQSLAAPFNPEKYMICTNKICKR